MRKKPVNDNELAFLQNVMMMAAEQYRAHALEFRKLIDYKPEAGSMMQVHGEAAKRIAEQFDLQAATASRYCQIFGAAEPFSIEFDEEQVEEDENPFHPESPEGRAWERENGK